LQESHECPPEMKMCGHQNQSKKANREDAKSAKNKHDEMKGAEKGAGDQFRMNYPTFRDTS
jgi:hypothetical protein